MHVPLDKYKEITIQDHLDLDHSKSVSYLAIAMIINDLKMTIDDYRALAHERGLCSVVASVKRSPVRSGTVHVFHPEALSNLLDAEGCLLSEIGWPTSALAFVDRISQEWIRDDDPALPVIKRAFGDLT